MFRRAMIGAGIAPALLLGVAMSASGVGATAARHTVQAMPIYRVHRDAGHAQLRFRRVSNLTYHGGQVETSPAIYIDFWGSWWNTTTTTGTDQGLSFTNAQAKQYIQDFFTNVGGSSWDGVDAQYCQGVSLGTVSCGSAGTHIQNLIGQLKGVMVDATNAVPSSPTQSAIAGEAAYAAGRFGIPAAAQVGATVMVFTPSGRSMSGFGTSWCAWHSVTTHSGANLPYAYIPYQPDAQQSCGENFINSADAYGNGYFDGFSVVGGHEYAEAETDPVTANGSYAWIDSSGSENGDKCAWNAASGDITLGAHSYAVQPIWSNSASGCVL